MIRKRFSILLVLLLSMSIIGCGSASAKNDSANANMADVVTSNSTKVESETVSEVSMPETKTDSIDFATSTASVDEAQAEVNYTGSFYTLPVGVKGEEWSEAQLDEYLKDCKPYQDNCKLNEKGKMKIDLDKFMSDFGFEYVGTFQKEHYVDYNVYWRQIGNVKYVVQFTVENHFFIYIDNNVNSVGTGFFGIGSHETKDDIARFSSSHFGEGKILNRVPVLYVKGIAAVLCEVTSMDGIDCGRLPFPSNYKMDYPPQGLSYNLRKNIEFKDDDYSFNRVWVYE